jgi:hypothetical protein
MDGLGYNSEERMELRFAALIYHPQRPGANPGQSAMMNKLQPIHFEQDHA